MHSAAMLNQLFPTNSMKRYYSTVFILFLSLLVFSNTPADSLVKFTDLSFHSEFEKHSFQLRDQGNELNLCLATDKNMTKEKEAGFTSNYNEMIMQLKNEKINSKNFRQKFKTAHKIIFNKPSMQYYENAEFSDLFKNGYFNYLTSTVLFSMALKDLNIPSFFLFTLNKADIIINPDGEQVILDADNRKDENGYFNSAGNKGYIVNMLDKNIRIGSEYQYNSSEGNVAVHFKESDVLKKNQLAATIYYYKALQQLNAHKSDDAYSLIKKACYLYPNETFVNSMYAMLTDRLQHCDFNKLEDVDLLGQLNKFKSDNFDYIKNTFMNVMKAKILQQNDLPYCTAAYNRLLPQITDELLANDISYIYYIACANSRSQEADNKLRPALEALKLKPNDKAALYLVGMQLDIMGNTTDDKKSLLDTLDCYAKEMKDTEAAGLIKKSQLLTYLILAKGDFLSNRLKEGMQFMTRFESSAALPFSQKGFRVSIENAYYEYAMYYIRFNNPAMAQKIVDKGLQYIPNSNMIQTATYNFQAQKPKISKLKLTKTEYDKYMKKNGPNR